MFSIICLVSLLVFLPKLSPQDINPLADVKTLSELPIDKLLAVKSSFNEEPKTESLSDDSRDDKTPEALALELKRKPNDRGGHGHVHYEEENSKKSGKKSVQSIFQISVTALAFLAFGGYLLCLLVQAIQSKNNMNNMNVTVTVTPQMLAALLRPRPIRRTTRRPNRFQEPLRRPNRRPTTINVRPKRDVWPDIDPETMYFALINLSEGYANYHTVDYKRFNYSSSYFN